MQQQREPGASLPLRGAGLGLRRELFGELAQHDATLASVVNFLEVAPENWIGVGGRFARSFREYAERFPLACHGLSLSLGSLAPLDINLLKRIKAFLEAHAVARYSEHLSYCSDERGHLYDLMPMPFTAEAVEHVAARIRLAQDVLERRIAVENVSCYATPARELSELEFINAVVERADCDLLLDVNNVFVNSVNFGYDAAAFLDGLPGERAAYLHIAGHRARRDGLRIDTHGAEVIEPVWALLERAYANFGVLPTLLERDFDFPPLPDLLREVARIATIQERAGRAAVPPRHADAGG